MLRGLYLLESRSVPALRTVGALGGLRGLRRRHPDKDEEGGADPFVDERPPPSDPGPRPVGRGAGSFRRFVQEYKGSLPQEEDRRNDFHERYERAERSSRDQRSDRSYRPRVVDAEMDYDDVDGDDPDDDDEEGSFNERSDLRLMGEGVSQKKDSSGRVIEEDYEQAKERERKSREEKEREDSEEDTYFDYEDENIFVPGLSPEGPDGLYPTDKILLTDSPQVRVGKLFWRRLRVMAKDLNKYVPKAHQRSKAMIEAMEETRRRLQKEGDGDTRVERKEERRDYVTGNEIQHLSKGQPMMEDDEEEGESDPEVDRLNAATKMKQIEREIGRLLVEYKFDEDWGLTGDGEYHGREEGDREVEEGDVEDGRDIRAAARDGRKEHREGEDGEEGRDVDEEDDDEPLDGAQIIRQLKEDHIKDIEDETAHIPDHTTDYEIRWGLIAQELVNAGGVIEFTSNMSDKINREMELHLPLPSSRVLQRSLKMDKELQLKADKAVTTGSPEDIAAHTWLALAKNPNTGEEVRLELMKSVEETMKRLQKPGHPYDRFLEAERKRMEEEGMTSLEGVNERWNQGIMEGTPRIAPEGDNVPASEEEMPALAPYDRTALRAPLQKAELARAHYAVHHIFGFDVARRANLILLEADVVAYAAGNSIVLLNLQTLKKKYVFGIDGRGVGCLAVHPSRKLLAVGEKGNNPGVYIYTYPEMRITKILRGGTERSYAAMAFDANGERLATLGGAPDYLLTVWDWDREVIVLHAKAFGQDVFAVNFSPDHPGDLVTSGTGHIRFWKMANTFTGLKLQGNIGKFGKVELSDIEAFAILPDGKVLTSTEAGALLVWEGNFIKFRIVRGRGRSCHEGPIYVALLERDEGRLVTAGQDGWVRWWDLPAVDAAEVDSDKSLDFELEPVDEFFIGTGVMIRHMARWHDPADTMADRYLLQDMHGAIWSLQIDLTTRKATQLISVPGGTLAGLDVSPTTHFAATTGADGTVRLWDYVARRQLHTMRFDTAGHCVRWAPATACRKGRTLAVGFSDGVVRVLYRLPEGLKLLFTFKPHCKPVTVIEYSRDGRLLATAGVDQTIFLLRVPRDAAETVEYGPIGFINVDAAVTSLSWRQDTKALLFSLENGSVGEVDLTMPDALIVNTAKSFEITTLPIRRFSLKVKSVVRRKSASGESEAEGGASASKPDSDAQASAAPGQDVSPAATSGEGAEPQDAAPGHAVEEEVPEDTTFSALQARYSWNPAAPDRFLLTVSGRRGGTIYECLFDEEYPVAEYPVGVGPRALQDEGACPPAVWSLRYSSSRDLLITSSDDGSVSVRSIAAPEYFARMMQHDGDRGHVVAAVASYDEAFLLSAGMDGLLVVHNLKKRGLVEEAKKRSVALAKEAPINAKDPEYAFIEDDAPEGSVEVVPGFIKVESSTKAAAEAEPDKMVAKPDGKDIRDTAAYSFQDEKLKTEEDNMKQAAEQKKALKRKLIDDMRKELKQIIQENRETTVERRLDESEFIIDKEYKALLEEKGRVLCEEVRRECEYDMELAERRLDKVCRYFLDDIEVEALELTGIRATNVRVSCLRTAKLSPHTQALLSETHAGTAKENGLIDSADRPSTGTDGKGHRIQDSLPDRDGFVTGIVQDVQGHATGAGEVQKAATWEIRKRMRDERKRQLQALLNEKPKDDAADSRDLEAIAQAELNMGDYKLKSSPNYEVPDDQRTNAERKMRQMVLLEESMYNIRMRFNRRVLNLRERKLEILKSIKEGNKRIREIEYELGQPEASQQSWEPGVSPSEWPESRMVYSESELAEFTEEVKARGLDKARPKKQITLPPEADPLERIINEEAPKRDLRQEIVDQVYEDVLRLRIAKNASTISLNTPPPANMTERQDLARRHKELHLLFERQSLIDTMHTAVTNFEEALVTLRREKLLYQADVKAAELKMLLLSQELALLRNLQSKDSALATKLAKFQADKAEVVTAINDCQAKLAFKKKDLEAWQSRDSALQREFSDTVPATSPFQPILLKIFKRKIKRAKKKSDDNSRGEGDEEDEAEEEEDEDFGDDDDFDEDEDSVADTCPAGCDVMLHDRVLELREVRLDQEELLQELMKSTDELKRTNDRHVQRQKQIDKDLAQTSKEIRAFQTEKQLALNQLDIAVPLTIKQVHCLDYEKTPDGCQPRLLMTEALLGTHVLMTKKDLQRLDQRTKELDDEIHAEKQRFKALHKDRIQLEKEKTIKEDEIAVAQARCTELQMLKFGQLIDLESLDQVSIDDSEKELKHKIQDIDNAGARELRERTREYENIRTSLLDATQRNTTLLTEIADLHGKQLHMEKELKGGNKAIPVADNTPIVKLEIEERKRLLALVELQAKELDVLKAECALLRMKGGLLHSTLPVTE